MVIGLENVSVADPACLPSAHHFHVSPAVHVIVVVDPQILAQGQLFHLRAIHPLAVARGQARKSGLGRITHGLGQGRNHEKSRYREKRHDGKDIDKVFHDSHLMWYVVKIILRDISSENTFHQTDQLRFNTLVSFNVAVV